MIHLSTRAVMTLGPSDLAILQDYASEICADIKRHMSAEYPDDIRRARFAAFYVVSLLGISAIKAIDPESGAPEMINQMMANAKPVIAWRLTPITTRGTTLN
jgi:hypothetical protein